MKYSAVFVRAVTAVIFCGAVDAALAVDPKSPPADSPTRAETPGGDVHGDRVPSARPPAWDEAAGPGAESGDGPGFGRRPFGRQRPRLDYDRMSEEEKDELEAFLKKHFPERFEELSRLDETAPRIFNRAINQMLPQLLRLMHMEEDDPEEFPIRLEEVKLSFEVRGAMRRLRLASGPEERARLLPEVRGMLARKFDLRQRMHRAEIQKLEGRLAEAKAGLERREADKEKIIDRELEDVSSGRMPPDGSPGDRPDGPPRGHRPEGPPLDRRPGEGQPPERP
jgi:hypothetical protein